MARIPSGLSGVTFDDEPAITVSPLGVVFDDRPEVDTTVEAATPESKPTDVQDAAARSLQSTIKLAKAKAKAEDTLSTMPEGPIRDELQSRLDVAEEHRAGAEEGRADEVSDIQREELLQTFAADKTILADLPLPIRAAVEGGLKTGAAVTAPILRGVGLGKAQDKIRRSVELLSKYNRIKDEDSILGKTVGPLVGSVASTLESGTLAGPAGLAGVSAMFGLDGADRVLTETGDTYAAARQGAIDFFVTLIGGKIAQRAGLAIGESALPTAARNLQGAASKVDLKNVLNSALLEGGENTVQELLTIANEEYSDINENTWSDIGKRLAVAAGTGVAMGSVAPTVELAMSKFAGEVPAAVQTTSPAITPAAKKASVAPPEPVSATEAVISGRQRDLNRLRKTLDFDALPPAEQQSFSTWLEIAHQNGVPERAFHIAEDAMRNRRPMSEVETVGSVQRIGQLIEQYDDAVNQIANPALSATEKSFLEGKLAHIERETDHITRAVIETGTAQGRALVSRKMMLSQRYDPTAVLVRARREKGTALTDVERARLHEHTVRLADVQREIDSLPANDPRFDDLDFERHKARGLIDALTSNLRPKTWATRAKNSVFGTGNFVRAWITAFDAPANLRQGLFFTLSHPIMAVKANKGYIRAFRSEKDAFKAEKELFARPNADLYQAFPELGVTRSDATTHRREDDLMSHLADRVLVLSRFQRGYHGHLNQMRADYFDFLVDTRGGRNSLSREQMQALARYVGVATGRGGLGGMEQSAEALANLMFSPRHQASRFQYLTAQPLLRAPAGVRAAIATEYLRTLMGGAVMFSLAKLGFGDDVQIETDPRSGRFAGWRIGSTFLDPTAGLKKYVLTGTRLLTGETINRKARRSKQLQRTDVPRTAFGFARGVLAPLPSAAVDRVVGKTVDGQDATLGRIVEERLIPLSVADLIAAAKKHNISRAAVISALQLSGMGGYTAESNR